MNIQCEGIKGFMHFIGLGVLLVMFCNTSAMAQWSIKEGGPEPPVADYLLQKFTKEQWEKSNFARQDKIEHFKNLRYGLMVSFGITAYDKTELSWGTIPANERYVPDGTALSDGKSYPTSEWITWGNNLTFENFDADEWIAYAKKAGFKYIVLLAKHHEGFHMWDTEHSDFKITNTPFGRDYIKEVVDACHKADFPVGLYYSQRDWYHPSYQPTGFGADQQQPGPEHNAYLEYQDKVVTELLTNYGKIDIFWWDALWWGGMFHEHHWNSEAITRKVRALQPGIIINNRASIPGDFDTPEQRLGVFQPDRAWEAAISLEETWSYSGGKLKTAPEVIKLIVNTIINDGNLLLSLGPKWSGEFEQSQKQVTLEVGEWLQKNSEAIYNTRGGPWKPHSWGGSTHRGSAIYIHATDIQDGKVEMQAIDGIDVVSAEVISSQSTSNNDEASVSFEKKDSKLILHVPQQLYGDTDTIIKLNMSASVEDVLPIEYNGTLIRSGEYLSPFSYESVYGTRLEAVSSVTASSLKQPYSAAQEQLLIHNPSEVAFFFETKEETRPWVQIDLGEAGFVTGVNVAADVGHDNLTFSVSEDGSEWETLWEIPAAYASDGVWDIEVNSFKAGAQTPGKPVRYIRFSIEQGNAASLRLKQIGIWSKDQQ